MTEQAAHNHPWKISDVVMFPALGIAIAIEYFIPSRIVGLPIWILVPFGLVLVFFGFRLISASKSTLEEYDQPSLPGKPTTTLVTTGPFRYSRNPNYLGAIMIAFGLGVAVNSLWFLLVAAGAMLVLDIWMIQPEERYLRKRFGQDFETYTKSTRRWF